MSAILEEALEEIRALPPEEKRLLEDRASGLGTFVVLVVLYAFLRKEGVEIHNLETLLSLMEKLADEYKEGGGTPAPRSSRRAALSRSIRGKYAHVRTSSDDFAQLKREEIRLEDRPR